MTGSADATTWLRTGKTASLWVTATTAATVYKIFDDGCRDTVRLLFGPAHGILISDRATVFALWAAGVPRAPPAQVRRVQRARRVRRRDRRIPDRRTLEREISCWQRARNAAGAKIKWMFGIEQARAKMGRSYPQARDDADKVAA